MTKNEQARADALADAETLRLNCDPLYDETGYNPVLAAGWNGMCAIYRGSNGKLYTETPSARRAARAAFRAVPGLRG